MVSQSTSNNPAIHSVAANNSRSTGFVARVKDMVHMAFGKKDTIDPLFEQWDQYRYLPEDQRLATPLENPPPQESDTDSGQPPIQNSLGGVLDYASHKVLRDYNKNPVGSNNDVIMTARALAYMERNSNDGGLAFNV
jgi:hypothetical protein